MTSLRAETVPVPVQIVLLSLGVGPLSYQRNIKRLIFWNLLIDFSCFTAYLFDPITYKSV